MSEGPYKSRSLIYYVVRKDFFPSYKEIQSGEPQAEILRGSVLHTMSDTFFSRRDEREPFEPDACVLEHANRPFFASRTFQTEFREKTWGPYTEEQYKKGLVIFRGQVGPLNHDFSLYAAGRLMKLRPDIRDRHCWRDRVLCGDNFPAIMGEELLTHGPDGRFVLAPTVDISTLLIGYHAAG